MEGACFLLTSTSAGCRLLCEFMGTFMLVFTVGCNVQSAKLDPKAQGVFVAVSIASSLMICIYALGDNPLQIILHAHAVLHNMEGVRACPLFVLGASKHCSHFVTASTHVHMISFTEKGADLYKHECMCVHNNSGPISGAHFNPAVTLGVCMSGKLDYGTGLLYWVAQVFAGSDADTYTHTHAQHSIYFLWPFCVCVCCRRDT
jgi:glycerol uptake facilitator-like aquaporin